mmetsp:Transcript_41027/g.112921  ORF Transcript_41027/g.112921 Transcript_41027/m.112921 type:complete len:204 (+) Transcript_41027:1982-2593(+)
MDVSLLRPRMLMGQYLSVMHVVHTLLLLHLVQLLRRLRELCLVQTHVLHILHLDEVSECRWRLVAIRDLLRNVLRHLQAMLLLTRRRKSTRQMLLLAAHLLSCSSHADDVARWFQLAVNEDNGRQLTVPVHDVAHAELERTTRSNGGAICADARNSARAMHAGNLKSPSLRKVFHVNVAILNVHLCVVFLREPGSNAIVHVRS